MLGGVLILIAAAVSAVPAAAGDTAGGGEGSLAGQVRERATSRPLAGAVVHLGGWTDTTSAAGRFHFAGLATGVYRLVVAGACDSLATLIEMRPGEAQTVEVVADTACAPAARLLRPDRLPSGVRREPLRATWVAGHPGAAPGPPPPLAIGEQLEDGAWQRVVVALPSFPGPLGPVPGGSASAASPETDPSVSWIALIDPGCFGRAPQFTLTRSGVLHARLLGPALAAPALPVLERQLCTGCVDAFFAELEASRLDTLSGLFTRGVDGGSSRTLGGVVAGKPFLVQVSGVRLALFAALKGRLLDLAAYRGCSDPSALITFDVETSLAAPDSVVAGREFEVRVEIAAAAEPVFGVVAALEVEGALAAGGVRTFSGNLDPLEPQQFAARFRVPEAAVAAGANKTHPRLATARLTAAVERGFLRQGGERTHPIRILAPHMPPPGGPARR